MTSEKDLECDFNKVMHVTEAAEGILIFKSTIFMLISFILFSFSEDELIGELIDMEEEVLEFDENEDVVIPEEIDSTKTSIPSTSKVSKIEQKDIQFMSVLSRVGGVLLSKSLAPAMKIKKKKAAEKMAELLLLEAGEHSTPDQIIKKVGFPRRLIPFYYYLKTV